jgi:phosphatidylglycerol:prolipoprotein diacylglycerol transferase
MYPELFHIGSLTIYSYGFFIIFGVLLAFLYLYNNKKEFGLSVDKISEFFLYCFGSVFVGGKLFYFLERPLYYLKNIGEFFTDFGQGFVFYGSFLLTIPVLIWWFRKNKIPVLFAFDFTAVCGALVHGMGKIGCFMAGCCHGIQCDSNWGVVFTNHQSVAFPLNVPVYPVQLWDATVILLIAAFLILLRSKKQFDGQFFLIYAIVYSVTRFFTEYYRGDVSRGFVIKDHLSYGQFVAIFVVMTCSYFYFMLYRKSKSVIEQ